MFCQTLSVSQTLDDYLQKSIRMSNHTKKRAFYKKKGFIYFRFRSPRSRRYTTAKVICYENATKPKKKDFWFLLSSSLQTKEKQSDLVCVISCCSTEVFLSKPTYPTSKSSVLATGNAPSSDSLCNQTDKTWDCECNPPVWSRCWIVLPTFPHSHLPFWTSVV